ncbi:MAG: cytochrome-c peroxidase [Gammaproteobacteria bacterium]
MILIFRFSSVVLLFSLYLSSLYAAEDTQWNKSELSILRSLSLSSLPPLPISKSNRFADQPQAQEFGELLFFDQRFSRDGKSSCASCHQPEKYFTDGLPRITNNTTVGRNTPTVVASGWLRWFYWDGRRDSLWSQALIPFEAADEMASSRLAVTRIIAQDKKYRRLYQSIFGELPISLLNKNLPVHAGPLGDTDMQDKWYRIPKPIQQQINRVYSNLGKSIAAYERTLSPKPTRFDHYVNQLNNVSKKTIDLTEEEIAGIKLFIDPQKTQCMQCHNGPLLTNGGFHNVGSGKFQGESLDFGRMLGLQSVLMDEFNCLGSYSDAQPDECTALRFLNRANHIPLQGAFKTPSLRNVLLTSPYFHDGRFNTLMEVMKFYNLPPTNNGPHELIELQLEYEQLEQLVAFLELLTEE